jgi:CDP-diacylglycerol---serine O-phosphatidyltransferase
VKYYKKTMWPNLLTFSNLFLGFFAILLFSQERFLTGCWLIVIAAIMDGLDGAVARLVKTSSKFGGEVDSLADVVSFGVAPSVLVFHMLLEPLGMWGVFIASLPLLAAATRLARYNILSSESGHSNTFIGMPTPGAALILTGFYIYAHADPDGFNAGPIWFSLIPLVSLLMISPIPYRRMPVVQLHGGKYSVIYLALVILVVCLLLLDTARFLFPLMMVYLLSGPVMWTYEQVLKLRERQSERYGRITIEKVRTRGVRRRGH